METRICDYGCCREATHQFGNGKWACDKDLNKCPGRIQRIKIKLKLNFPRITIKSTCLKCGKKFDQIIIDIDASHKNKKKYCSRNCACGIGGHFTKGKKKKCVCITCGKEILVGKNAGKNVKCKDCQEKINYKKTYKNKCLTCGEPTNGKYCKYHFHQSKEYREKRSLQRSNFLEKSHKNHGYGNVQYYKIKNIQGQEFYVRGTWELKYAKYLNNLNILCLFSCFELQIL